MLALLDPGDEAIIFEPAYDAYVPDVHGGRDCRASCRLHAPDWHFDPDELRAAFARRPKLLLLNTPHNPTGKVFTRAELELIAALCQELDVLAIADEVYDRIVFTSTTMSRWRRCRACGSAR